MNRLVTQRKAINTREREIKRKLSIYQVENVQDDVK